MAWHNCSMLSYTESSAWVQPGFVNVIAIKQPLVFLCLNMVVTIFFLRWKVEIFKHAYQQLRAEKEAEHPTVSVLPFFTIDLSLLRFCSACSTSLSSSLHAIFVPAFGQLVQNLKVIPRSHSWMLLSISERWCLPKELRSPCAPGWVTRERGSAWIGTKKERRKEASDVKKTDWKTCLAGHFYSNFSQDGGGRTGFSFPDFIWDLPLGFFPCWKKK